MNPGGSRHDACMYTNIHGRVGAQSLAAGHSFNPAPAAGDRAAPPSLPVESTRPAALTSGAPDPTPAAGYLYIPGEPPRPVFIARYYERLADVYWQETHYVVHTCVPREWVMA